MKRYLFFLAILASLSACRTDFDVLAPYKETTVVFGLLNPDTTGGGTIQYIRINKSFLGEGNAYEMAKNKDSINYRQGDISVTLLRMRNGSPDGSPIELTDTFMTVEEGPFARQQLFYKTSEKILPDPSTRYHLNVKNNRTGKVLESETSIIGTFNLASSTLEVVNSELDYTTGAISWSPIEYYHNGDTAHKYFDTFLGSAHNYNPATTNSKVTINIPGEAFFQTIKNKIAPSNLVSKRIAYKADVRFVVINQEFYNYLQVSKPSTGIVQDKPDYTNIQGGLGFFGCRYSKSFSVNIGQYTMMKLRTSEYTSQLDFK
jgi:hypothetical protein